MGKNVIALLIVLIALASCGVRQKVEEAQTEAFQMLADQNFKTSLSLIELYKLRHGKYPASLDSITFISSLDENALTSVKYERLDTGYRLDMADGFMGKQKSIITYPPEFWQGTGVKQSNLLK